ncbi:MAG: esterase [Thermoplasmatales archaeon I-plasma]|nr:MAG: esterase [Thermoplasmatales archaeon I-plasma]
MQERILTMKLNRNMMEMALDPNIAKVLQMISDLRVPNLRDLEVKDIRNLVDNNMLMKENIEIGRVADMSLGDENIQARLYEPKDATRSLILYFHGGGFVFGSIESYDSVCRRGSHGIAVKGSFGCLQTRP